MLKLKTAARTRLLETLRRCTKLGDFIFLLLLVSNKFGRRYQLGYRSAMYSKILTKLHSARLLAYDAGTQQSGRLTAILRYDPVRQ